MKKMTSLLMAAILSACLLTGCGGGQGNTNTSSAPNSSTPAASDKESVSNATESTDNGGDNAASAEGQSQNEQNDGSSTEESSAQRDYREEDAEYEVENGVIVVNQDGHYRAMELFGGSSGDTYVETLNSLRSKLDSSIRIYSVIAPLSCEFYLPANYEDYSVSQKDSIAEDINSRLDSGITPVDVVSALGQHTSEAIYCRTDHHWMPLGAYYAAKELASAAGVDFADLSTYEPVTIPGFVGTMYAFTDGDIRIKEDPEDFTYYKSSNYPNVKTDFYDTSFNYDYTGSYYKEVGDPQSNAYLTFFGGDEQIVKVRTDVKNGRKLLIVKDSYGNAVPGFLMNSFEEIYIVDMRYFNPNLVDFINQLGITDVAMTMCVFSAYGENSKSLRDSLTQNEGQTIVDGYDPEA